MLLSIKDTELLEIRLIAEGVLDTETRFRGFTLRNSLRANVPTNAGCHLRKKSCTDCMLATKDWCELSVTSSKSCTSEKPP